MWPVLGRITGSFGHRLDPFSGKDAIHSGLDIASRYGDAVHATADGIVARMGLRRGYGRLIVIDHGLGVTTLYGHLSRFSTRSGTHVRLGDIIGYEGRSGRSTGTHLHYEVRVDDTPVDPSQYLRDVRTYLR
jgi:murein DD-endopeptidase MepM/ murein hydrolase activator NlpD